MVVVMDVYMIDDWMMIIERERKEGRWASYYVANKRGRSPTSQLGSKVGQTSRTVALTIQFSYQGLGFTVYRFISLFPFHSHAYSQSEIVIMITNYVSPLSFYYNFTSLYFTLLHFTSLHFTSFLFLFTYDIFYKLTPSILLFISYPILLLLPFSLLPSLSISFYTLSSCSYGLSTILYNQFVSLRLYYSYTNFLETINKSHTPLKKKTLTWRWDWQTTSIQWAMFTMYSHWAGNSTPDEDLSTDCAHRHNHAARLSERPAKRTTQRALLVWCIFILLEGRHTMGTRVGWKLQTQQDGSCNAVRAVQPWWWDHWVKSCDLFRLGNPIEQIKDGVRLSDANVFRVRTTRHSVKQKEWKTKWPYDFIPDGDIKPNRRPIGKGVVIRACGMAFYPVFHSYPI